MDRSFEEIRTEVFELDRESQQKLVEEIEQRWSAEVDEAAFDEANRRMEAYERGEMSSTTASEALGNVRRMVEENRRKKR